MDKNDGMKIKITRDGPYEVSGNVPLQNDIIGTNEQGDAMEWIGGRKYEPESSSYCLCRCGKSHTKPMCDGTHDDAGFCGHERADRPPYEEQASLQTGEAVDLLDDESLCVGARFCDVGKSAWNYAERSADPRNREKAIEETCKCPSGRLTIVDQDGKMIEPDLPKSIGVVQDPASNCRGPLWVKGGIPVEGANGEQYETRNRVTLCRCGASTNQPYCDGSHYNVEEMQGADE